MVITAFLGHLLENYSEYLNALWLTGEHLLPYLYLYYDQISDSLYRTIGLLDKVIGWTFKCFVIYSLPYGHLQSLVSCKLARFAMKK